MSNFLIKRFFLFQIIELQLVQFMLISDKLKVIVGIWIAKSESRTKWFYLYT